MSLPHWQKKAVVANKRAFKPICLTPRAPQGAATRGGAGAVLHRPVPRVRGVFLAPEREKKPRPPPISCLLSATSAAEATDTPENGEMQKRPMSVMSDLTAKLFI